MIWFPLLLTLAILIYACWDHHQTWYGTSGMKIREALQAQGPSLALQRACADELAKMDKRVQELEQENAALRSELLALAQNMIDPRLEMKDI